ncbi:non-ribosomal peptide synthetase [Streptomyces sp. NPDC002138]|uniref:non-ribosomal peptide synthetase n=1 Tax=Streptomyces sp. NPDC002138 TaxID=3154410 RepID=UPI00332389E0
MVSVAQLYVRDVPLSRRPERADLLQVLWCPFDHEPDNTPLTALFWRTAAEVGEVLTAPPEPYAVEYDGYVPQPCLLAPERVTEYPNPMELSKELQQQLADGGRWEGTGMNDYYRPAPDEFYWNELSVAPGWKAGGWTRWGLTDPVPRLCPACGAGMDPLLTIASSEWGSNTRGWIPYEDQPHSTPSADNHQPWNPTGLDLARGYDLQLHVCPVNPDHPHLRLVQ